ncbi:MAG: hypothetical protein H7337_06340 [Rhizobacter sp.]|nr:hypothetical protein [Rhizobacter sp.]
MKRSFYGAAFFVGLIAVCWIGFGYIGSNPLALTMTALIGATYLVGALELGRFQQATSSLSLALAALPAQLSNLGDWLVAVHPSLRNTVRQRIEGERVGLPGPALTPYLVGLLVLLGMLGTFLGMVVTLNGAAMALEGTSDLAAIRAALTAPVKGLGLAFGTSVAGVAASAMLGLLSALCRRERLQTAQGLDAAIATCLRAFSLAHQREETLKALQLQARAMPEVADKLQAMMAQMALQGEALNERLLAGQDRFHHHAQTVYAALAASVDQSLKHSLTESARIAGATIQPVAEATMNGIAREVTLLHEEIAAAVSQHSASLLLTVGQAHAALQSDLASNEQQRLAALVQSLEAFAASQQREWQQAGAQQLSQQEQICKTLERTAHGIQVQAEAQARNTVAEIARLMQAASDAPRAAAEVIGLLREKLSDSMARDNGLLEERGRIMATLGGLLDAVNHAAVEQRGAIDTLVVSSAELMQKVSSQFSERIEAESAKVNAAAAQITGSAVEVASLGEAFGFAVQLFSESSNGMMANLQRIEAALTKSTLRSDEQLAYYVAQAREIIDLSIVSQKQIVEDLRQLSGRQAPVASEVA